MSEHNSIEDMLDVIAKVLIRSFIIGIILLAIRLFLVIGLPDWVWQKHAKIFDLTREQVAQSHSAGMLVTKAGIFGLFFFPYFDIKLVQGKRDTRPSNN